MVVLELRSKADFCSGKYRKNLSGSVVRDEYSVTHAVSDALYMLFVFILFCRSAQNQPPAAQLQLEQMIYIRQVQELQMLHAKFHRFGRILLILLSLDILFCVLQLSCMYLSDGSRRNSILLFMLMSEILHAAQQILTFP